MKSLRLISWNNCPTKSHAYVCSAHHVLFSVSLFSLFLFFLPVFCYYVQLRVLFGVLFIVTDLVLFVLCQHPGCLMCPRNGQPSPPSLCPQALLATLLQGLTWFSATQTGCRWLISYIEQKKFLACKPEISVDFSAPPEFSGGEMEKF